jgi:hydroxyacylglutathione hydrolase
MEMASLYFKQLQLGPMQNFVYLVGDTVTREAAVIDAAWDIERIIDVAAQDDMKLTAALVTHFHPDHLGGNMMGHRIVGAADLLEHNVPLKVYLHKTEAPYANQIAGLSDSDIVAVESGDELKLGELPITFIHTPGHTPGSQCFLVGGCLVSGDTLFIGSCGRVDLPGSDPSQLYDSLVNKLKRLPDDTVLYPGHDYADRPSSTIGEEKRRNMYMRFDRLEDFLHMMGY